ncbi:MAG: Crp/Fnr family transcriptional regulator [Pseudomonadota bacterium]
MSIRIKIGRNAKEIDDALWVRHEVFVIEDGKFGGKPLLNSRLMDRFDSFPNVFNVIAYEGAEPIATIRLVKESECGVPAEELFDFSSFRAEAANDLRDRNTERGDMGATQRPVFGNAGMLAIRGPWRRRRDVIRAMFRMAAAVCKANGATHVVVAVNHETAGMYRRLGFTALSEKIWIEEIENHIVPLAAQVETFLEWALGKISDAPLTAFEDSFEREVLRAGEVLFQEGDAGTDAYIVESGAIRISRRNEDGQDLVLTDLPPGGLFGELALIDNHPRSATATATVDTELIKLDRHSFLRDLRENPERAQELFQIFSGRIRRMDELAMMLAFAPDDQRLSFALEVAKQRAEVDRKDPTITFFRGGPEEFARIAAVEEQTASNFLAQLAEEGELEYSDKRIKFVASAG